MKIVYICHGDPLTGKSILASLVKENAYVIDNYVACFAENLELATKIDKIDDDNGIFFIVCNEYPADLILTLDLYLSEPCKVIAIENRVIINKEEEKCLTE